MKSNLEKIVGHSHHDPYHYLGAHFSPHRTGEVTIRTFQPQAVSVTLVFEDVSYDMELADHKGLFTIVLSTDALPNHDLNPFTYQFMIVGADGQKFTTNDPYRFDVQLGEQDRFLFNAKRNYRIHEHMGAHPKTVDNVNGTIFHVWAPNATPHAQAPFQTALEFPPLSGVILEPLHE